jgi:anti-sigma regulatory factor (Ser/Thr protein kinase)
VESFHHSALLYSGPEEYAAEGSAFLREAVQAGDPALAMVGPEKITLLRDALGSDADSVSFVDIDSAGHNPAWIIPAWRDFADSHPGESMRGIGEPICANRGPDELVECQRHESLLNLAFLDADGFQLLCPYDSDTLETSVIEEARRSHPHVAASGTERPSGSYRGTAACAAPNEDPLPEPHTTVHGMPFGESMIDAVRRAVERHAARAGLPRRRREDLVLAVNELAANSVRHGGGYGRLRLWAEDDRVVCEVRDRGAIKDPLAGRRRPDPRRPGGYGLWLANQVCDLVQVRSLSTGGVVRLHMNRR